MNVKIALMLRSRRREADTQRLAFGASSEESLFPASNHAITMGLKQTINPIGMAKKLQNWSVVIIGGHIAIDSPVVKPTPASRFWPQQTRT